MMGFRDRVAAKVLRRNGLTVQQISEALVLSETRVNEYLASAEDAIGQLGISTIGKEENPDD